ncbi:hypothetical protein DPMN_086958 [Dreissena polymorpha]|uniref:Uncharacterized protein n=1 Tax=Dreissena polymorpha TaxID=45954 RepID=A0A9D4QVY0_DREPO|nr:hypothetical protein DPMN_086958 [Dreissena polymorpha]
MGGQLVKKIYEDDSSDRTAYYRPKEADVQSSEEFRKSLELTTNLKGNFWILGDFKYTQALLEYRTQTHNKTWMKQFPTMPKITVSVNGVQKLISNLKPDKAAVNDDKLLTMSMDETVLSSLRNPAQRGPTGVHVSETGQLLVVGYRSHNVVQVDETEKKE